MMTDPLVDDLQAIISELLDWEDREPRAGELARALSESMTACSPGLLSECAFLLLALYVGEGQR